MLKTLVVAGAALAASISFAQAQMYTYTTQDSEQSSVGGTWPDGRSFGATYGDGEATITYADGKKVKQNYTCVSMTQAPSASMFQVHFICDHSDADGTSASAWGCNAAGEDGAMSCVGAFVGKTGKYEGRYGNATFASAGDGKGKGTGQWNN